jgi:hypothetical protein
VKAAIPVQYLFNETAGELRRKPYANKARSSGASVRSKELNYFINSTWSLRSYLWATR